MHSNDSPKSVFALQPSELCYQKIFNVIEFTFGSLELLEHVNCDILTFFNLRLQPRDRPATLLRLVFQLGDQMSLTQMSLVEVRHFILFTNLFLWSLFHTSVFRFRVSIGSPFFLLNNIIRLTPDMTFQLEILQEQLVLILAHGTRYLDPLIRHLILQ